MENAKTVDKKIKLLMGLGHSDYLRDLCVLRDLA